jgi:hypothetical protein
MSLITNSPALLLTASIILNGSPLFAQTPNQTDQPPAMSININGHSFTGAIFLLSMNKKAHNNLANYPTQGLDKSIIRIDAIPNNINDFLNLRNQIAYTPEGGAMMFLLALRAYGIDKRLGQDYFTISLDRRNLRPDKEGYKGFSPDRSFTDKYGLLDRMPYLFNAYILGATPENQYLAPSQPPLHVQISRNAVSIRNNGDIRLFLHTHGSDAPRPITLSRNSKGIWKVLNPSSLFIGLKPPVVITNDNL